MSGPAPPNPNAPRKNPGAIASRPNIFLRYPGRFATGAILLGTAYLYNQYAATPRESSAISLRTTGVQNIEKAYTNAGATPTHTKAYGGTTQGDSTGAAVREGGGTGVVKDGGSPFHRDGTGDDQRPKAATKAGEIFDQSFAGSPKGESQIASDKFRTRQLTDLQASKE